MFAEKNICVILLLGIAYLLYSALVLISYTESLPKIESISPHGGQTERTIFTKLHLYAPLTLDKLIISTFVEISVLKDSMQ